MILDADTKLLFDISRHIDFNDMTGGEIREFIRYLTCNRFIEFTTLRTDSDYDGFNILKSFTVSGSPLVFTNHSGLYAAKNICFN